MELDVELAVNHEPQANKSFSVQQFYKNAAEVWASSPHLRSKSKLHNQMQSVSQGHRFFPNHAENPLQYH